MGGHKDQEESLAAAVCHLKNKLKEQMKSELGQGGRDGETRERCLHTCFKRLGLLYQWQEVVTL